MKRSCTRLKTHTRHGLAHLRLASRCHAGQCFSSKCNFANARYVIGWKREDGTPGLTRLGPSLCNCFAGCSISTRIPSYTATSHQTMCSLRMMAPSKSATLASRARWRQRRASQTQLHSAHYETLLARRPRRCLHHAGASGPQAVPLHGAWARPCICRRSSAPISHMTIRWTCTRPASSSWRCVSRFPLKWNASRFCLIYSTPTSPSPSEGSSQKSPTSCCGLRQSIPPIDLQLTMCWRMHLCHRIAAFVLQWFVRKCTF
mmetsp:Transcript_61340/g.102103  ORF Transcript_61340/g.102103 Transcript_61340/m.102103 type:complete len:260 (-) Transcript_61340:788-1567(-)